MHRSCWQSAPRSTTTPQPPTLRWRSPTCKVRGHPEVGAPRGLCPASAQPPTALSAVSKEEGAPPKLKCELCGRVDFAYKFKRSKRFCSMACAKRYRAPAPRAPPRPHSHPPHPPLHRCLQVQRGLHEARGAVPPRPQQAAEARRAPPQPPPHLQSAHAQQGHQEAGEGGGMGPTPGVQ